MKNLKKKIASALLMGAILLGTGASVDSSDALKVINPDHGVTTNKLDPGGGGN